MKYFDLHNNLNQYFDYHYMVDLVTLNTPPRVRMFWTNQAVLWALGSLPLALVKIPGLGLMILRLRETGYDQAGNLRLVMTKKKMAIVATRRVAKVAMVASRARVARVALVAAGRLAMVAKVAMIAQTVTVWWGRESR